MGRVGRHVASLALHGVICEFDVHIEGFFASKMGPC